MRRRLLRSISTRRRSPKSRLGICIAVTFLFVSLLLFQLYSMLTRKFRSSSDSWILILKNGRIHGGGYVCGRLVRVVIMMQRGNYLLSLRFALIWVK
jgi:hypothetical protein